MSTTNDPIPELDEAGAERLADYLRAYNNLRDKTPKELVDLALNHMTHYVTDIHYEQVIEELCTRVWPNWSNEDPPQSQRGTAK